MKIFVYIPSYPEKEEQDGIVAFKVKTGKAGRAPTLRTCVLAPPGICRISCPGREAHVLGT